MLSSASLPARLWLVLSLGALIVFTLFALPARLRIPSLHTHELPRNQAIPHYASGGQDHCPSLHRPPRPIDHAEQFCSTVPSADPAFGLELCHVPTTCNAFTLRVARTDARLCRALENADRTLSHDPELDAWLRREVGPDVFEIRTDGAERVAGQAAIYEGDCHWRFDVQLRNAGPVWLSAWHTYEYYQAFDEVNGTWPNALSTPLFPEPISLNICNPLCAPTPPTLQDPSRSFLSFDPFEHASSPHSDTFLPTCSETDPVSGSYLPVHLMDLLYPPAPLPQSTDSPGEPVAGRYRFVPHGCHWTHAGQRFGDPSVCTARQQRVLVWGDSHGRVVADGLYHRLSGQREIMLASEKQGHKFHQVGNVSIEFFWDPKGSDQTCTPGGRPIAEYDAVIVSMAQHFNWGPTSNYTSELASLLDRFNACPGVPARRVYLPSPAWPPRTDWWVSNFDDQRTNARLRHWRDLAVPLARARGWRAVDQFALSAPHIWEVNKLDKAHFLGTDALDPILDEVVAKAGVCGVPPETQEGHHRPGTGF